MPCCRFQLNRRPSHFRVRFLKVNPSSRYQFLCWLRPNMIPSKSKASSSGLKPPACGSSSCGQLKRPFPIVWCSNHGAVATKVRIYAPKRAATQELQFATRKQSIDATTHHPCRSAYAGKNELRKPITRKGRKIQRLERSSRSPELKFTSLKNAVLTITKLATARMALAG
jgi:hypothetical protein